jgi:hypothetical protein
VADDGLIAEGCCADGPLSIVAVSSCRRPVSPYKPVWLPALPDMLLPRSVDALEPPMSDRIHASGLLLLGAPPCANAVPPAAAARAVAIINTLYFMALSSPG